MTCLLRLPTGRGPWVEVELHRAEGRFKPGEVVSKALSNEFEYIFAHLAQMANMLEVAAESMSQTSKCT